MRPNRPVLVEEDGVLAQSRVLRLLRAGVGVASPVVEFGVLWTLWLLASDGLAQRSDRPAALSAAARQAVLLSLADLQLLFLA